MNNQNNQKFRGHGGMPWLGAAFLVYMTVHIFMAVATCEVSDEAVCTGQRDESAWEEAEELDPSEDAARAREWASQWRTAAAAGDHSFDLDGLLYSALK
jgi:hypothetical protein